MSFPSYPEYKELGIPWLGEIPLNWEILPFFSRFPERKHPNKGMKNNNLLSLSYGRIIKKDINTLDGLLPESYETYQVVQEHDIVFRLTDLQNDKRSLRSAIVSEEGIITSAYLAVAAKGFDAQFANHLFRAYDLMKVFYSMGGGLRQSMKYDDMKWLPIISPSLQEQTQIARFLDHETAKIDALICEQERLIALLQEKRQGVISHAVTKGLDPSVPMKDSGVEWLGEVPAHWEVKPLRYLGECQNGINIAGDAFGSGFPFIGYGHVYKNDVLPLETNELVRSSKLDRERYSVQRGDVFFTRTSETVDEVGFSATCFHDIDSAVFAGFLIRFRPLVPDLRPEFSRYYFSNQRLREFFNKEMNLVTRASLSQDLLKKMEVTLPPVQEQSSISSQLDKVTEKVDSLISEARTSSELLVERRSALISAAVTGKIDVRDWQPPADESAFAPEVSEAGLEVTE